MIETIDLGGIVVEVVKKDIKNIHLSVYPPSGKVRISAPLQMSIETIRVFAITKLDWIRRQQYIFENQERETQREFLNRESHYLWGKRYLLEVVEVEEAPKVEVEHSTIRLSVRPHSNEEKRQAILSEWHRDQVRAASLPLISQWEGLIGVKVKRVFIQTMKTKWGSCNHLNSTIRLNSELAKKPKECLEYIVMHEMIHILEPTHSERFVEQMNRFLPNWMSYRDKLNRLPLKHETWQY
jgi:predicted metal-dependent hydrolase